MIRRIKIAGIPIEVHTLFNSLYFSEPYITEEEPVFKVDIVPQDVIREQQYAIREAKIEGIPYQNFSPPELENTAVLRKIAEEMPNYDGFLMHCCAVAVNGKAYLFTAKSGTGKTTHARLWLKNIEGSYVLNGDKPMLRFIDGVACVCGTPWMGKEAYGRNEILPVAGICFLDRGEENRIERVDLKGDYFRRFCVQVHRSDNGNTMVKTVKLINNIGLNVPIYQLYCNMNDDASVVAFKGMNNLE